MECLDENSVVDYLEGWLTSSARAEVEQHIDLCGRCRTLVSATVRGDGADDIDGFRPGDELLPGSRIDHFQVMRRLGRGSMGEVYLCRDIQLGRRVALKVVRPDALGSMGAVQRFLEEARTTARFSHPHIVTIHAAGVWRDVPYIALEYLEGETLEQRMERERPSTRETLRIGLAIAQALAEAHRHRVLHRDLKPANVLLPRDGRLRVVDFSLAKVIRSEAERARLPSTDAGFICGTPTHMSPEQWLAKPATEAADIWALGVILYELVSGRRPFHGATLVELGAQVTAPKPIPPPEGADALPGPLVGLIMRCLEQEPDERPSAEEVCSILGGLLKAPAEAPPRAREEHSPFRGLLPFHEEHADLFFGRDAEIAAFLERIREQGVLPVVGPSGAGKTSFVQAGVIPRLREQGRWLVLQIRPGEDPFASLANRLARGPGSAWSQEGAGQGQGLPGRDEAQLARDLAAAPMQLNLMLRELARWRRAKVLLFVDQLEELITLVADPQQQALFLQALCGAGDDPNDPVRVIFTLRDDFLGRLALGPRVRETLGQVTILRSPEPDALEQIVTSPLALSGYRYDDEQLPGQMVAEVAGEPSALPLLQFTTQVLWERRDQKRRLLLRTVYDEIGGVAGALARHADSLLEGLSPEEVGLARELLLRLVTPDGTRRAVRRKALLEGLPPVATHVLERLTRGRLLSVRRSLGDGAREVGSGAAAPAAGEGELELAHESLLRDWGRLARWIDESHEELALLAEMTQAAELWTRRGERETELWQGDALREAQRALKRSTAAPARVVRFVEAGQRREQGQLARRRRQIALGMVLLVLVAVAALVVAFTLSRQKQQAEQQRAEAQREGARAAMMRGDLLEARAKLRGSLETRDSALTRLLWWRLLRVPLVWRRTLGAPLQSVAISPEGGRLAVAGADRSVRLIDARTGALQGLLRGHRDQVLSVAFSPDGRQLASGSWDGEVWLWDVATRRAQRAASAHTGAVWGVSFSPDGRHVATCSADKTAKLWDLRDGRLVERRRFVGHTSGVYGVAFGPRGHQLASGGYDQTVRLWEVASGEPLRVLRGHSHTVYRVSYSPDGRWLVSGSADRTTRLWDVSTGKPLRVLRGHTAGVAGVAFSPDGRLLATASYDKSLRLWQAATGRLQRVLEGHGAAVVGVQFSPDGRHLASASRDTSVALWEVGGPQHDASALDGHAASVWSLAFSPDGVLLASASKDESLRLWEVATGAVRARLAGHAGGVQGVSFSPDGKLLASAGGDRAVHLWTVADTSRDPPTVLTGHASEIYAVGFSPDGKLLASAGYDQTVRLWDLTASPPRPARTLKGHAGAVYGLAFNPDGRLLASAGYDRGVRIWDLARAVPLRVLSGHRDTVYGVAFLPGEQLITGSGDGTVRRWSLATGEGRSIGRYPGRVYWLAIHPDGERVGIPVSDGTARILDLKNSDEVVLRGHRGEVNVVRFSPDGKLAATGSDDGTVRLWDARSGRPHWRAPALLPAPPRLVTHRGWVRLAGPSAMRPPDARWARALEGATTAAAAGQWLCLATGDGLELWDTTADRQLLRRHTPRLEGLEALPGGGCVTVAAGRAELHPSAGEPTELVPEGATAVAVVGRPGRAEILVAAGQQVAAFSLSGARQPVRLEADVGVTAMARSATWLVLGYGDGNIELVFRDSGRARQGFSFSDVPASPVERLIIGPMDTLIAGYANGLVGIWDLRTGGRLDHARLHGPVVHLLLEDQRLYAATELGGHLVWDLRFLYLGYCQVLRQVWSKVPVVWVGGRPVFREPPSGHRCAPR